jgi:hypothetical protein
MRGTQPTYQVGDHVRVVPGARNNTPRRGSILQVDWHYKEQCHCYYIQVCGKRLSKRYREEDLVPDSINASWLTSNVVALAGGIRDVAAFDRLPILADALEESGCDDEAILSHCRGPKRHASVCGVLDLLLGKS